jgi:hypothetical protein
MQCGYRSPKLLAPKRLWIHSVAAYSRAGSVRSPESCGRQSLCDSNGHSGPFAATATEAHTARRNPGDGTGTLVESHIPGNKIRRRAGSKRVGQRKTQKPPRQNYFNPLQDAKLQIKSEHLEGKGSTLRSPPLLQGHRTCKAPFRRGKVRRRRYLMHRQSKTRIIKRKQ